MDGCPAILGEEPVVGADDLDDPEEPDFWPQEGTSVRKRSNPAVQKQAVNCLMGRFIGCFMGCLTGRETSVRVPAYAGL